MKSYKNIEKLYKYYGITDYKLRNTEDLLKIHGVDFKAVKGYKDIDDINRVVYEKFIINFLNGSSLESRMTLVPKEIHFVEDTNYLIPEKDYRVIVGGIVKSIDRNGVKSIINIWIDNDYKDKN